MALRLHTSIRPSCRKFTEIVRYHSYNLGCSEEISTRNGLVFGSNFQSELRHSGSVALYGRLILSAPTSLRQYGTDNCNGLRTNSSHSPFAAQTFGDDFTYQMLIGSTHDKNAASRRRVFSPSLAPLSAKYVGLSHNGAAFFLPVGITSTFPGRRCFHSATVLKKDESKVEETLEALKDTIKKVEVDKQAAIETPAAAPKTPSAAQATPSTAATTLVPSVVDDKSVVPAVPPKKSMKERVIHEIKHYYHGFRLLFIDFRVAARLIWQVLNGRPLMRREQKQLVRTTADLFRLVPFLVFVLVPFAELTLPIFLKLFPGMLPSTFKDSDTEMEKRRKRLKMKLEMAKFLQDTIEETALTRKGATGESVHDFVKFLEKIRTSGVQTSNEEILKYSKLFEDEITLDNLSYNQLSALCKLLEIPTVGTSYFLRFQLEMKLRQLEADDKVIQKEGIESMEIWELQEACRMRGMRGFGVPEARLKSQLAQWLDLHLNRKIPTSLLLLSRTLYLPEHLSAEDQLKATISTLPEATAAEAKVKILEVSGDRVDNKSKLEVIKQEEEIIQQEKLEAERQRAAKELQQAELTAKLKAKMAEALLKGETLVGVAGEVKKDAAIDFTQRAATTPAVDIAANIDQQVFEKSEEIHSKDLEQIEDVLQHVAESKAELTEAKELKALKEDVVEYKESLEDIKEVVESSGGALAGLTESKAAQRLSRKVQKMIKQMDVSMDSLSAKKDELADTIKVTEVKFQQSPDDKKMLETLSAEKKTLITITELLDAIKKLQNIADSAKFEKIAKVLDEDKDGVIDYNDAMKVIELLGSENVQINPDQMSEIMVMLKKEKEVIEEERKAKSKEKLQTPPPPLTTTPTTPATKVKDSQTL